MASRGWKHRAKQRQPTQHCMCMCRNQSKRAKALHSCLYIKSSCLHSVAHANRNRVVYAMRISKTINSPSYNVAMRTQSGSHFESEIHTHKRIHAANTGLRKTHAAYFVWFGVCVWLAIYIRVQRIYAVDIANTEMNASSSPIVL